MEPKITTMTVSANLTHPIDILTILPLISLDEVHHSRCSKQRGRFSSNNTRNVFLNTISTILRRGNRNISVKIFCSSIHVSGASSFDDVKSIAEMIVRKIHKIRRFLELVARDKDHEVRSTLDHHHEDGWKGELRRRLKKHLDLFDEEVRSQQLDWIYSLKASIPEDFGIASYRKIMVNYNFNIGFRVHHQRLFRALRDVDNVFVYYDRCIHSASTIKIVDDDDIFTFIIKDNGNVTQSGPSERRSRRVRRRFLDLLESIKEKISI